MNNKGILMIISGFSGAGKGTVVKEMLQRYENYALSVSATTRQPREGEAEGVSYFFKSQEAFEQMIAEDRFIEYAKNGYPTEFVVTLKIPHERYEFDIENGNMSGHWTGIFTKVNGRVKVTFIEEVKVKKIIMRFFVGMYLRKQQKQYIADLKHALGEDSFAK